MRLHHLSVSAFGPFAGTEHIDFAELNDAGLFLLTGPTGAGKTSLLDAICFALYGSVPGVRGVKTLKSQHAPADSRPEVVLDFSIRDRRFVLRRSPEWSRPKRRGSGTTEEKSSATLIETTSGEEHLLSSRAQEVGHLISGLIGMNAAQFVQVAMLPQGEFQTFLRATSQERHGVLQHLFKTDRFARIEDWVHDHSRHLREAAGAGENAVQRILDTMADRAGAELPEILSGVELSRAAGDEEVKPWAEAVITNADCLLDAARTHHHDTLTCVDAARSAHMEATQLATAIGRRVTARAILSDLEAGQHDEDAAHDDLECDTRASGCLPILRLLEQSLADHRRATHEREAALVAVPDSMRPDPLTAGSLTAASLDMRARITRLEVLLPREKALASARTSLSRGETEIDALRTQIARTSSRRDQIPDARAAIEHRLARAGEASGRRELLAAELAAARKKLHAAQRLPAWQADLAGVLDESRDARDRAADARQQMQDTIDRRLSGIAAELAGRLGAGEPCQVCGSTDHPRPAEPSSDAVTKQEQDRVTAAYDAFRSEQELAAGRAADVQRQVESLVQATEGLDATQAAAQEAALMASLSAAEAAETERRSAETEDARLAAEAADLTESLHQLQTRLAMLEQSVAAQQQVIATIGSEIAEMTGQASASTSLMDVLASEHESLAAVEKAAQALVGYEQSRSRSQQLTEQAQAIVEEHGFGSVQEARAATLAPERRAAHERLLAARAQLRSRAQALLDDDEVLATGDREAPDLVAAGAALEEAQSAEDVAARAMHEQELRAGSLRANLTRLEQALADWSPARDSFVRAEAMSKLVRGMGGDNQLQMRLSAYVLATRLDQVVAAANERLAHMRDQRYLLERTGESARKGAQAGLGLRVVDEWTGEARDPATLSGGETFVVSLSLALGLADVVTQEAGGTDIETLFIDEGFGMLDPDTLDDVMDRLDGLRAGGRTVGVVSHVSELRNRIPTQVHIEKTRSGSSVAVRTLIA